MRVTKPPRRLRGSQWDALARSSIRPELTPLNGIVAITMAKVLANGLRPPTRSERVITGSEFKTIVSQRRGAGELRPRPCGLYNSLLAGRRRNRQRPIGELRREHAAGKSALAKLDC
jgi:hypothetical protein